MGQCHGRRWLESPGEIKTAGVEHKSTILIWHLVEVWAEQGVPAGYAADAYDQHAVRAPVEVHRRRGGGARVAPPCHTGHGFTDISETDDSDTATGEEVTNGNLHSYRGQRRAELIEINDAVSCANSS